MSPSRSRAGAVALLLAAPLLAVAVWLVAGGFNRSFGPTGPVVAPDAGSLAGLRAPDGDLAADRFHERVDGAADALIRAGCRRLRYWGLADPAADLEILSFEDPAGASEALARDAGPERTPGPGDESSVAGGSIFFRRGRHYVRVLAAPTSPADREGLLALAGRVDRALAGPEAGSP